MPIEVLQSRHQIDLASREFQEMRREFRVDRAAINKEARTVPLSFASEEPVRRWYGDEILEISTEACDLSRLNNGGAFLVNHNWDDQVGVTLEPAIDSATKKARCVAKFSRSARGEEIFQDILDGIRSLVSVGYIVRKMVLQSVEGDVETHRVTDWQPFEVSVVAVPADTSVGIGRSTPRQEETPSSNRAKPAATMPLETTPAPAAAPAAAAAPARSESDITTSATTAERTRTKAIRANAEQLISRNFGNADDVRALANRAIDEGMSEDQFNREVLGLAASRQQTATPPPQGAATVGLTGKDRKRYSMMRAIRLLANLQPLDGLEREASDELARKLERPAQGFFVPDEVLLGDRAARAHLLALGAFGGNEGLRAGSLARNAQRTLLAGSPSDGGYTVPEELLISEFVELLRNTTRVFELGARVLPGLQGNVSVPTQLTGAAAYWVGEGTPITRSSATFGQIQGRPKRLGTSVPYSKEFLAQTSLAAEAFVREDSLNAQAVELDRVAINGAGNGEPLGILNLPSASRSTSVTFGGAATWAKYVEFLTNVATNNALLGTPGYLTTPASMAKAMTIAKFTNTGFPIWDENDKIGAFRARWSNQFPSSPTANQVIFGDFSQVVYLEWAGIDVIVDPFTGKREGTIEITIQRLADLIIRRAKSFAISSDTGAA